MALTVLHTPEVVSLSRNPIVYEFSTNNLLSSAGQFASHFWQFSALPSPGDQARLEWLDGAVDLTFVFDAAPDDSGLELPTGAGTVVSYLANVLIPALKRNYYVDRDFNLSQSNDRIFFDAKEKGPAYDILFTSGNFPWSFTQNQAGVNPVERPNFRLLLTILYRYRGASEWERVEWERVPIANKVAFDISPLLRALDKMVLPATNLMTVLDLNSQVCEFQVAVAEAFGSPVSAQRLSNQSVALALNGGYSEKDKLEHSFIADWVPNFLTWKSTFKVDPSQPAFLAFLNNTIYTNFWVIVRLYGASGSLGERAALSFTAQEHDLKMIPAHYDFAVSGQSLDEEVLYYEIWVQRQNTTQVISNKIRFNLRRDPSIDTIYLAFKNSFGVLETASFIGSKELSTEIKALFSQAKRGYNTSYQESGISTYQSSKQDSFLVRSGYLTSEEIHLMQDLLLSSQKFIIIGTDYIPVHLEELEKVPTYQSLNKTLYTLELELKLIPDQNFSYAGNRIV